MTPLQLATQSPDLQIEDVADIGFILAVIGISLLIMFAISIVICAMLYVAQKRVPPEHQQIEPLTIWLLLIPIFNLVWNFFVFRKIPQSYRSYFNSQGRTDVGDCGEQIGLWYSICMVGSIIPCLNYVAGPAALVLLIIFLVKIYGLRGQIPEAAVA
jgi:hypothetical protein